MTNFRILIIILAIGIGSCSKTKGSVELKKAKAVNKVDYKKYDRFWITYEYPNNNSEKVEVYVSKENDTINNQIKFLKNGIIDSIQSRFFEITLEKSKKVDTYNGTFHYYSEHDSNPKNIEKERRLRLSIFQKSRDSSYYQKFESKGSNKVEFELVNYESDQLIGIMWEMRFIQKDVESKDMAQVIETHLAVDNKPTTNNLGIEIYKLKKR